MLTVSKGSCLLFEKIVSLNDRNKGSIVHVQDHAPCCALIQPCQHGFCTASSSPKSIQQKNADFECRDAFPGVGDDSGIVSDYLNSTAVCATPAPSVCVDSSSAVKQQACSQVGINFQAKQTMKKHAFTQAAATNRMGSPNVIFIQLPTRTVGFSLTKANSSQLGVDNLLSSLLQRAKTYHYLPIFFESLCHTLRHDCRIHEQQQPHKLTIQQQPTNCSSAEFIPIKELQVYNGQDSMYYRPTHILGRGNFGQVYISEVKRLCQASKRQMPAGVAALKLTPHVENYKTEHWVHEVLQRGHTEQSYKSTFLLWMSNSLVVKLNGRTAGCLILELASGGSLHDLLTGLYAGKQRMLEHKAVFYVAEVACAIDYMHSRGCLHMDIKADNVLLAADGHVRLADFGHSLRLDRGHARCYLNAGLKTFHLPAEVLYSGADGEGFNRGSIVTKATDWFSFGCLAYWLLHNSFPILPPSNLCTVQAYADYMQFDGYQQLAKSTMQASPAYRRLLLALLHPRPRCRPCGLARILQLHGDVFASWLPTGWRFEAAKSGTSADVANQARAMELRRLIESGSLLPPFVPTPLR